MDDGLISEADACREVGLSDTLKHRSWLRELVKPVIENRGGHTCRRYRRSELEPAAVTVAEVMTKRAHENFCEP